MTTKRPTLAGAIAVILVIPAAAAAQYGYPPSAGLVPDRYGSPSAGETWPDASATRQLPNPANPPAASGWSLGRRLSRTPPSAPSPASPSGTSSLAARRNASTPQAASPAATAESARPLDLGQRLAQRRLERLDKVRDQLQQRLAATQGPTGAPRTSPPASVRGVPVPAPSDPFPPVVVESLPPREIPLVPPEATPPNVQSQANANAAPNPSASRDPSHEITIDLPDESETPRPRGLLNSRGRGNRSGQ